MSQKRPDPRDKRIATAIDFELYQMAKEKAKLEGRTISGVIRAFLQVWVDDGYPSPAILESEKKRAKKRKKE